MNSPTESAQPTVSHDNIVLLIPDVFFSVNVRNAVRYIGGIPQLVKTLDELVQTLHDAPAILAVLDLTAVPESGWDQIGNLVEQGLPVLVFGPHKYVDQLRAAKDAGVTRVVANSQFHRDMLDLMSRYAAKAPISIA